MAAGDERRRPTTVLLFSGKRKCGKDYVTDAIHKRIGPEKCVIIRLSGPIKKYWAQTKSLQFDELLSDGEMKEQHRKAMIDWSENIRFNDYGYFCRMAIEMYDQNKSKEIWIVSDARRKTDIAWFKANYNNVKLIRITADECTRKERGWTFIQGVDDAQSECDLDDQLGWDWIVQNNKGDNCNDFINEIVNSTLTL
ncbi:Higher eukaryotic phosphomevalonate kinase [Cinara cedri]|uniref:Phosphomevalonate kinase n=1 Tax=Cinara cedri TaxID=506608 RepID=A0A5E4MLA1_9HEMI|nr:Higher eukaryotic phosphomevalonate kinase [Cinara cedri]